MATPQVFSFFFHEHFRAHFGICCQNHSCVRGVISKTFFGEVLVRPVIKIPVFTLFPFPASSLNLLYFPLSLVLPFSIFSVSRHPVFFLFIW